MKPVRKLLRSRRLRWVAAGAVARFVLRRSAAKSVDRATADIEQRLPEPVARVLNAVPADVVRAGGSAMAAGKAARQVAGTTKRVGDVTARQRRNVLDAVQRVRSVGDEISGESERRRRELKAQYLRATQGNAAADDALLDLRSDLAAAENEAGSAAIGSESDELPEAPAPVSGGRWRAKPRLKAAAIQRVQRSYQPKTKAWDR